MTPITPTLQVNDLEALVAERRHGATQLNERRKLIRNEAACFFLEHGLGATTEEFLSRCGISREYFFEHFNSKDEVLGIAICAATSSLRSGIGTSVMSMGHDHVQTLRDFMVKVCYAMSDFRTPEGLGSEVLAYYPCDHPLHETALACKQSLASLIEELCRQASVANAANAARLLLLVAEGSFASRHLYGEDSVALGIDAADYLIKAFVNTGNATHE